jgi:hypothetical protein
MFDRACLRMRCGYLGIMSSFARRPLGKSSILLSISALVQDDWVGHTNLSLFLPKTYLRGVAEHGEGNMYVSHPYACRAEICGDIFTVMNSYFAFLTQTKMPNIYL